MTERKRRRQDTFGDGGYMWVALSLVFAVAVIGGAVLWVRSHPSTPAATTAAQSRSPRPSAISVAGSAASDTATQASVVIETSDRAEALQRELKVLGYYDGVLDGVFGPSTQDALRKLQAHLGVPATGVFDAPTWQAASRRGQLSPSQTVMSIQLALKNLGQYKDTVDGQFGPGTIAAIRAFERRHGLPQDGVYSPTLDTAVEQALDGND